MTSNSLKNSILLADDDASIRFVLSKYLTKCGYNVRATDNAQTLLKWVKNGYGDVVLSDVHMDRDDIFDFVPELAKLRPSLPIIIMSANTSVVTALKSGSSGVFDYIPKPFDLNALEKTIRRALNRRKPIETSNRRVKNHHNTGQIIGKSASMQPVFRALSDFMSADIPVYIYGDVGTGKNHVAEVLHTSGNRAKCPFVDFEEHEILGPLEDHVLNGDLFVNRLHEISHERQAFLLKALERNERRVHQKRFRVISTGPMPLNKLCDGRLRPDLYFRLTGGEIALPPLSHRIEDIPQLASHLLYSSTRKNPATLSKGAVEKLQSYNWSGNVRELKNLMEMLSLKFSDTHISPSLMNKVLQNKTKDQVINHQSEIDIESIRTACHSLLLSTRSENITSYVKALSWVEKPLIEEALRITGGNKLRAAELLGVHRNTLRTRIKYLGLNI